ncbi:F0F1 ATP synthase subunit alpha [bacterium]|nr:F0F1 ATP synthase subunit alpha [bacterium]
MKDFDYYLKTVGEIGYVEAFTYDLAYVSGIPNVKIGEMVITENNDLGMVIGMDQKLAEVLIFSYQRIRGGERITRTNQPFSISFNENVLGRVIDPLCSPLDGLPLEGKKISRPIENEAPNITERVKVNRPMETGVMLVDLMVPIGYGQRELVIGDRETGKTLFLMQAIANQVKKGVVCVYAAIGKNRLDIKNTEQALKKNFALENTTIIAAPSDIPSSIIYLAPFTAVTIAEYFRDTGKDVLLILDDLTNHAKIYREISLLLKRMPGRDAYPGDIFHIHAKIMERTGNIRIKNGEVSITALPVAQTLENNLSGYIQTNLMAMTDGHIFFDINEFRKGKFPAINIFLSVSRVGNQTKSALERSIADLIRRYLSDYRESLEVATFGVDLPEKTKKIIDLGKKIELVLEQDPETIIPRTMQILIMGLLLSGFWDKKTEKEIKNDIQKLLESYNKKELLGIEESLNTISSPEELKAFIRNNYQKIASLIK